MNLIEYNLIENYSYTQYVEYLKFKYGNVLNNYITSRNCRSEEGLFIHHIGEIEVANLCDTSIASQNNPKFQEPKYLCYCDYLEHSLLHVMIGEETAGSRNLGLQGDNLFILPALRSFYKEGIKQNKYNNNYYQRIKDDEEVFDIIFDRYNKTVENADLVIDHNKVLYLQVEEKLNNLNKALVVLGTGLGKTTTALQYLWKHQCRALVIGPNNLIKSGWESYGDWVDTITYQAFANNYKNIDYSNYGLIILDEAHHAGYDEESGKGAAVWSRGINYLLKKKGIKLLGLTATPERSDKIDIGKTIFKDCVCEGLAVEDAIERSIIHPFSYVTAIYDTKGIVEEVKNKYSMHEDAECKKLFGQLDLVINNTLTLKDIIVKYMPKEIKRKGIIFIQEITDKEYVKDIFKEIYPNIEYRAIDSKMSYEEVAKNRKWFEDTNEGYLIAVNMISEGAHYKGINTLIMFRRTSSYLVYTQQLGRIITLIKDENPNAIVFDLVNNIENIRYNDRKLNKRKQAKEHSIVKIIRALEKVKSEQIIIADETRDIVECIRRIKDYNNRTWQDWEDDIIRQYYSIEGDEITYRLPKRNYAAIQQRACVLNVKRRIKDWEPIDLALISRYSKEGGVVLQELALKYNTTVSAISARKKHLKLYRTNYFNDTSNIDICKFKDTYEKYGAKYCCKCFNIKLAKAHDLAHKYNIKQIIVKKVKCIELNTVYSSARKASDALNIDVKLISNACSSYEKYKTHNKAGNYHWRWFYE